MTRLLLVAAALVAVLAAAGAGMVATIMFIWMYDARRADSVWT